MSFRRLHTGRTGEKAAALFLEKKGYRIVETNFTTRSGEIDIIAREGNCIIFVEVKSRHASSHGSAFEAVNTKKQQQIGRVALEYLSRRDQIDSEARFDVVSVLFDDGGKHVIAHIENAFDLSHGFS